MQLRTFDQNLSRNDNHKVDKNIYYSKESSKILLKVMDPVALSKKRNSDSDDDDGAMIHESWKIGPVQYQN